MFISSKYNDIIPLFMDQVYKKIGHSVIPIKKIKQVEFEILEALKWNTNTITPYDYTKFITGCMYNQIGTEEYKTTFGELELTSLQMAKYCCINYDFIDYPQSQIAFASYLVGIDFQRHQKESMLFQNDELSNSIYAIVSDNLPNSNIV